jgi:hypothetical protein
MDGNQNKKLLIAVGLVLLFAIVVVVWYFYYANQVIAPSLEGTNDPQNKQERPVRFQFLTWGQNNQGTSITEVSDPAKDPLIKIWDKPATGATFITTQILTEVNATTTEGTSTKVLDIKKTVRATSTTILFVDRITGYVYAYPFTSGKPYQVTNTLLPGIYDAYIVNEGKRIVLRYPDREKNTVVSIVADIPSVPENGTPLPLQNMQYLPGEVTSISSNRGKTEVSYVVTSEKGSTIYTLKDKNPKTIASNPFKEWDISYGGENLFLTTKPSAYVTGITFSLPLFQSETGERTGLLSNPGPSNILLNSMWTDNGLATFFSNKSKVVVLPFKTLASKCSWGIVNYLVCAVPRFVPNMTEEGLPDDWFQGRISFSDDLKIVDTTTGDIFSLYTFSEKEGEFDITNIDLSQNNDLITFIRKQDSTLWLVNTNNLKH